MVSVYNVYGAIIFGISQIVMSISNGSAAGLGNLIALNDKDKLNKTVNQFEFIQAGLTTVLYSVTAIMLIPFIRIYTVDMIDADYIQPIFGYILILAEAIYCLRCIYSTVSTSANKFKETQLGAILECVTNLVVSLVCVTVLKLGLVGVAIGTVAGSLVRYIFEIVFLSQNVIHRHYGKAIKMLFVSIAISVVSIFFCNLILDYSAIDTFVNWTLYAILTTIIVGAVSLAIYCFFYKEIIKSLVTRLKGKG
jgi:hypothetical protein